jgi:hypothetical protein
MGPTNLVTLIPPWASEEDQLPPEGYSDEDLEAIYGDSATQDDARAAEFRAEFSELARMPGGVRRL